ncbi:MAG: YqaE/Pmp3 family membrane protein [Crocinitomicaceae bacterium]|nr:YqaE/Pmp3 family membrane protein [Crocinitomicaceae bacterium]
MLILLVILAIILPPLAVFLFEGATGRFWITLILWLLGWGVGWYIFHGGLAGLCSLVAIIFALLIVLGVI